MDPERRRWLGRAFAWTAGGGAVAALAWILLDVWAAAGRFSSARWLKLAALGELPGDSVVPFPEARLALLQRAGKIGALSLECTHLGCLVNVTERGFLCPCHGSEFGPLGEVYTAPARKPLPWHLVQIRRGHVWVHSGRTRWVPFWVPLPAAEEI